MKKYLLSFVICLLAINFALHATHLDYEDIKKIENCISNDKSWHPLNYAIEINDYETGLIICKHSDNVNVVDDGFNPINRILHKASKTVSLNKPAETRPKLGEEKLKLIWAILKKGINVNYTPSNYGIPPHSATSSSSFTYICFLGLEDLFHEFVKRGVNLNQCKGAPLVAAIKAGQMKIIQNLLEEGANANFIALRQAVISENFEAVNILVQFGANINEGNLLMTAICQNKKLGNYLKGIQMLKFLLELGANPNAIAPGTNDPVIKVVLKMPSDTIEQRAYKVDVINILIEHGASIH
ncbi:ankyrin repeat domain-containing protein [Estrella lausannensis]|uniref:Uncharacterized protein n=1 Tax=Estrella lausannensis TaxID=483423 RepID=A0A0H5DRB0_9BACT|nr:ankyrin repeat domain-containing protein [Estrella lausannensis]CRX38204.1 hypothetical protein ELAC_0855 [Estrella lausannensis]